MRQFGKHQLKLLAEKFFGLTKLNRNKKPEEQVFEPEPEVVVFKSLRLGENHRRKADKFYSALKQEFINKFNINISFNKVIAHPELLAYGAKQLSIIEARAAREKLIATIMSVTSITSKEISDAINDARVASQ